MAGPTMNSSSHHHWEDISCFSKSESTCSVSESEPDLSDADSQTVTVTPIINSSHHHHTEDIECFSMSESTCSESEPDILEADSQTEVSSVSEGSFTAVTAGSGYSFDDCSIDSIGDMLIKLGKNDASLTEICVDCKSMGKESAAFVEQCLPKNTRLKKIILRSGVGSGNRLIFHGILSSLKRNSSIESLGIQGAEINSDSEMASWLLPFFACSKLKHISMVDCTGPGLEELFVAMQHNKCIQQLTFHSCRWEEYITDMLLFSLPFMNLRSLSLVEITIAADGWPYLCQKILECGELTQLDLSRNRMDASSIYLLTKSLTSQQQISKLSLSSCGLDNLCIEELAKGLQNYSTIKSLDISRNTQISGKGVAFMKELLHFNHSITDLKVYECGLNMRLTNEIERELIYNDSFLKCFCSFALFDCVDSICDPREGRWDGDHANSALQPTDDNYAFAVDKRDADETTFTEFIQSERSLVNDDLVLANEECSITTEEYS